MTTSVERCQASTRGSGTGGPSTLTGTVCGTGRPRGSSSAARRLGSSRPLARGAEEIERVEHQLDRIGGLARRPGRGRRLEGHGQCRALGPGHPHQHPFGVAAGGYRADHLRARGQFGGGQHLGDRVPVAGERGHPHGRRKPQFGALGQLAGGEAGRVPADQRLHGRHAGVGADHDRPARPDEGGGGHPAAQRLLAGAQVGPREQCPAVEQQRGAVAAGAIGSAPGVATTSSGRSVDRGQHPVAAAGAHRRHRGRPDPAPRRCACTDDDRAHRPAAADRASPVAGRTSAPPAVRHRARSRREQRAVAGGAPGRRAIAHAGQGGHVAATRDLHQHRGAGGERIPRRAPGQARQPGRGRGRVAGLLDLVAGRHDARRAAPHPRPLGDDLVRPARFDEQLRLGRPREAAEQQRRAGQRGAQHEHVAGVGIRRAGLVVEVVTVVPDASRPSSATGA